MRAFRPSHLAIYSLYYFSRKGSYYRHYEILPVTLTLIPETLQKRLCAVKQAKYALSVGHAWLQLHFLRDLFYLLLILRRGLGLLRKSSLAAFILCPNVFLLFPSLHGYLRSVIRAVMPQKLSVVMPVIP